MLSLHDNKLYGTETLLALGSIPKLKKLNLSRNRFKRVPMVWNEMVLDVLTDVK